MSDEGSDAPPPEPVPPPPGKKFFISNVNTFVGQSLIEELRNEHLVDDPVSAHSFVGTETNLENAPAPPGVSKLVSQDKTRSFRKQIMSSDVVIYDLMTADFDEVDHVIKTFKTAQDYESEKTLILISSVMTWVNTPPKFKKEGEEEEEEPEEEEPEEPEEGEEEEKEEELPEGEDPPPQPIPFKERDFHLRVPSPRFQTLKTLETLALSSVKAQPKLRVYVLCAGILYGNGERIFYNHFKKAWLQAPEKLPYIGKGDNLIPTIHVIDLARLVRRVVNDQPDHYYIFAVDRTRRPTQKRLVQSISKGIGTSQVEPIDFDSVIDEDWSEVFSINVFLKSSPVLRDGTPPDDAEDPDEAAKALKFPWHAEKGIIGNTRMLNDEFNKFRGLNPVKVFITGPPASGKSHFGGRIAEYYNIPHVTVKDAVALMATLKGEWADGIREQIEAKKDEIFEELEKKAKKGQEPNRDEIEVRLEEKWLYTLMRAKLNENACRNRGYILDGYPRTFKDAQKVFLIKKKKFVQNEDGEMVEAEEEEEEPDSAEEEGDEPVPEEEKKEKDYSNFEPDPAITPSSLLRLDAEDDFLKQRVKELPEEKVQGTHLNDADLDRRLKAYREANNSAVDDPNITAFFEKYGIDVHASSAADEEEKVFEGMKIFVERSERPKNFMTFDQEREGQRKEEGKRESERESSATKSRAEKEEDLEQELKKEKKAYSDSRLE